MQFYRILSVFTWTLYVSDFENALLRIRNRERWGAGVRL
jgi:hypothetical protein